MSGRLFYCPLESYPERYTQQLSAPITGWLERRWREHRIPYTRVAPFQTYPQVIRTGSVLDAIGRTKCALIQIDQLLNLITNQAITNDDVIYFDDFWHPGIEGLKYALELCNLHPRIYSFFWAQSVDEFDFTHSMKPWMRSFEQGIMRCMDSVFVANTMLKNLILDNPDGALTTCPDKIHVVGLPFDTEEVVSRVPPYPYSKKKHIIFSSRWDKEKNSGFFLQVAERILQNRRDVKFIVCTGAPRLRSNDQNLITALAQMMIRYPDNIFLKQGLTKEEYYSELQRAKIQFNCADQDWVSFTLLEAVTFGCYPIYPRFRSFPEVFGKHEQYMYEHKNVVKAANAINLALDMEALYTESEQLRRFDQIVAPFNDTWARMTEIMGLTEFEHINASPYRND